MYLIVRASVGAFVSDGVGTLVVDGVGTVVGDGVGVFARQGVQKSVGLELVYSLGMLLHICWQYRWGIRWWWSWHFCWDDIGTSFRNGVDVLAGQGVEHLLVMELGMVLGH